MLWNFARFVFGSTLAFVLSAACAQAQVQTPSTRMVVVEGKAMRVQAAGLEGRQPGQSIVVLETGAGGTLGDWQPIFGQLSAQGPIIAYDRRGLGQSEADSVPQTLERVARSLHALLQEMKVPAPYVLVGASWGAAFIREFATLFPQEVAGYVYLDATDIDATKAETDRLPAGATAAVFDLPAFPTNVPPGMLAEIESLAASVRSEFSDLRALRPPVTVPVAVIVSGAKGWPGASPAAVKALLQMQIRHQSEWALASPNGLFLMSTKARHFVHRDEPGLVLQAISYRFTERSGQSFKKSLEGQLRDRPTSAWSRRRQRPVRSSHRGARLKPHVRSPGAVRG